MVCLHHQLTEIIDVDVIMDQCDDPIPLPEEHKTSKKKQLSSDREKKPQKNENSNRLSDKGKRRMKTVEQCHKEIKKLDPDTALSVWFIRCLCKENKVKHFMTGTKVLVNYDDLLNYLNFGFEETAN